MFQAATAIFSSVNLLPSLVEGQPVQKLTDKTSEAQISAFIENRNRKLGVHSVGFTKLQPPHIYSHGGRGIRYGQPVQLNHKFASAFTVEMDHRFIQLVPQGSGNRGVGTTIPECMVNSRSTGTIYSKTGIRNPGTYRCQLPGNLSSGGAGCRIGNHWPDGIVDDTQTGAESMNWCSYCKS